MPLDGNNIEIENGDRVYSFDWDGSIVFGTLYSNDDYPEVSEWYIAYDDGFEGAVLDMRFVYKA